MSLIVLAWKKMTFYCVILVERFFLHMQARTGERGKGVQRVLDAPSRY